MAPQPLPRSDNGKSRTSRATCPCHNIVSNNMPCIQQISQRMCISEPQHHDLHVPNIATVRNKQSLVTLSAYWLDATRNAHKDCPSFISFLEKLRSRFVSSLATAARPPCSFITYAAPAGPRNTQFQCRAKRASPKISLKKQQLPLTRSHRATQACP